jgi:membrane protein implicated in regulation of membrane protease activity
MTWWLWSVVGFALLVAETIIPAGLFLLFFGVAALLLAAVLCFIPAIPIAWQWIIFALGGPLLAITLKPYLKSSLTKGVARDDRDNFTGERAIAIGTIAPQGSGTVEHRGTSWQATNVGNSVIMDGESCAITGSNNLTLLVRKDS